MDIHHPLRLVWLGPYFVLRRFSTVRGIDRSASLAYVTLLSLVPLLATMALLYRAFFSLHTDRLVEMITLVLPYSTDIVKQTLAEFVSSATEAGGIGSLIFLAIVFRLYLQIETALNDVWCVTAKRTPAIRTFSFTMVVFWGPVVIGIGSTLLYWMSRQPWAPSSAMVLAIGRVTLPLLGLTMVYWLAPHTGVHIGSAFVGGLTATIGLHLLRTGFVAYLRQFDEINIIYGSLGLAIIFLVSLYALWMLVILGAVTSYVVQNMPSLLAEHDGALTGDADPVVTSLAILTECYRRSSKNLEPPQFEELESDLGLSHEAVRAATERLLTVGLAAVTGANRQRYVPAREASRLSLGAAARALAESTERKAPGSGREIERLGDALRRAATCHAEALDTVTFADLLDRENETDDQPDDKPAPDDTDSTGEERAKDDKSAATEPRR